MKNVPYSLAASADGVYWAVGAYMAGQMYSLQTGAPIGAEILDRHVLAETYFTPDGSARWRSALRLGRSFSVPDGQPLSGEMIHQDGVERLAAAPRRATCTRPPSSTASSAYGTGNACR